MQGTQTHNRKPIARTIDRQERKVMEVRNWKFWTGALMVLAVVLGGCSSDDDNPAGSGSTQGQYELHAGFVNQGSVVAQDGEAMVFIATVERRNASDPSAKDAIVTVDGTVILLMAAGSTDDDATFMSNEIEYNADATYSVTITIGDKTASALIETPDYDTTVAITAPLEGATFVAGEAVSIAWAYTGDVPGKVVLAVMGGADELFERTFAGSTTSHTIPAATTNDWDDYDQIEIFVGIGEMQSWSGDAAFEGSYSYVLIATATVSIVPQGEAGQYAMVGILWVDDTGGDDTFATTVIERLNSEDPGANTFTVSLNGASLPLLFGNPGAAYYEESLSYSPGTTYTWTVTGEAGSATAAITAPSYSTAVRITAPADSVEFIVGTPLTVTWEYTGDTPDNVVIAMVSDDYAGGEENIYFAELPGTTTSHTFSTDAWGTYDMVDIGVSIVKEGTWAGTIVDPDESEAILIISTDDQSVYREGQGPDPGSDEWDVYFSISQYYIDQGASSDATVEVLDDFGDPCPDGTAVTFTVDPAGAATVSPNPATTTDGVANVTVTAVAASGSVTVTATALEDSDSDQFEIGDVPERFWMVQTEANPEDPPLEALPVGESVRVELSIVDLMSGDHYESDVRLVLNMLIGGHVTIFPTEVTIAGGGGTATVTVTGVAETDSSEMVLIEAPDPGNEDIAGGGFFVEVVSGK